MSNTINPRKTSDKGHDPYTSATTSLMYVLKYVWMYFTDCLKCWTIHPLNIFTNLYLYLYVNIFDFVISQILGVCHTFDFEALFFGSVSICREIRGTQQSVISKFVVKDRPHYHYQFHFNFFLLEGTFNWGGACILDLKLKSENHIHFSFMQV